MKTPNLSVIHLSEHINQDIKRRLSKDKDSTEIKLQIKRLVILEEPQDLLWESDRTRKHYIQVNQVVSPLPTDDHRGCKKEAWQYDKDKNKRPRSTKEAPPWNCK